MPTADFHNRPFDEGTLTKLQIFELYTREWLPVFLAKKDPPYDEIRLFDFFAGPGTAPAPSLAEAALVSQKPVLKTNSAS